MTHLVPSPSDNRGSRDLGDEFLFYDRDGDQVHVLNRTAREVFLLCDGIRTVAQVAEAFSRSQPVGEATARRDAEQIIHDLAKLGLLKLG